MRIMGLDPGSKVAGYVILERTKEPAYRAQDFRILDAGALKLRSDLDPTVKLGLIHEAVYKIASEWLPNHAVIEKAFFGLNHLSALRMGETRGAMISGLRRAQIVVHEIAPTTVKKRVAGHGRATKDMVYECLRLQMNFDLGSLPLDVSDAIAIGVGFGLEHLYKGL